MNNKTWIIEFRLGHNLVTERYLTNAASLTLDRLQPGSSLSPYGRIACAGFIIPFKPEGIFATNFPLIKIQWKKYLYNNLTSQDELQFETAELSLEQIGGAGRSLLPLNLKSTETLANIKNYFINYNTQILNLMNIRDRTVYFSTNILTDLSNGNGNLAATDSTPFSALIVLLNQDDISKMLLGNGDKYHIRLFIGSDTPMTIAGDKINFKDKNGTGTVPLISQKVKFFYIDKQTNELVIKDDLIGSNPTTPWIRIVGTNN